MDESQIKEIFKKNNGIMRTKNLSENGIHYRMLEKLIESGKVEKIRYGYYQWQDERAFSEASVINALFPDGILCMDTALLYYDYTDRTPTTWHIAIENQSGRSRFLIDYPSVRPHFTDKKRFLIGASEGEIDGIPIHIYDRERTICDCLRHVNRMDGEIFSTALKRYVQDPVKNIPRLMQYAKALGVEKKVRGMIGIWL